MWDHLTNSSKGAPALITVAQGRTLSLPRAAKGVAEVDFHSMCDDAKGSTDYMALAQHYQTIIIRKVPQLTLDRRDILRRFILLIDQLYYFQRKVIIEADYSLEELFKRPESKTAYDEEFAFERCVSRLKEMQTREYQEKAVMKDHLWRRELRRIFGIALEVR